MTSRKTLTFLGILALAALLAPTTFAGCGEICNFMDCEASAYPEEGCIERPFACLDLLCFSATTAACETESAQVEERIDAALEGVDTDDPAAVAAALGDLGIPIRYTTRSGVLYETPNFEIMKERQRAVRRGEAGQVAETGAQPQP